MENEESECHSGCNGSVGYYNGEFRGLYEEDQCGPWAMHGAEDSLD